MYRFGKRVAVKSSLTNYSQNTESTNRQHKLNEMVENLRKIVDQSSVKRSTRLLKISIDSTKYRSIADNFSVDSTFREIGRLDRSIRSVPGTNLDSDLDLKKRHGPNRLPKILPGRPPGRAGPGRVLGRTVLNVNKRNVVPLL